uniref:Serine carboxypeptidase-like 19 n=1 Tax=Aegilops tauschii subsp. strangulata TaxID=200361 RepID=A0A453HGQ5_AEGTS
MVMVMVMALLPLRQLIFLLCFFSALPRRCRFLPAEAAPTLVASLPGFDGPLPFRLETGYVTVDEQNGSELFYYFIESEGDPRRDPVIVWITGGDRCSVLSALLFEIGPLKLIGEPYNGTIPRLRYHPYAWTKVASVLFVDSPVGAGFSFSLDPRGYDVGEISSSLQLKKFLTKWFTEHPDYLPNSFYVGGDSSGGKIVPFLAQKISEAF